MKQLKFARFLHDRMCKAIQTLFIWTRSGPNRADMGEAEDLSFGDFKDQILAKY